MIFNQNNVDNLRLLFSNAVINISEWLERFLSEFKGEEVRNTDKWHKLYDWLNDTRLASAPEPVLGLSECTVMKARHDLIDEIMEYMEELEEEENDET